MKKGASKTQKEMGRGGQRWADYVFAGVIYHIIVKGLARTLTVLAGQYSDCAMASPEWAHQDATCRALARRYTNTFKDRPQGESVTVEQCMYYTILGNDLLPNPGPH